MRFIQIRRKRLEELLKKEAELDAIKDWAKKKFDDTHFCLHEMPSRDCVHESHGIKPEDENE